MPHSKSADLFSVISEFFPAVHNVMNRVHDVKQMHVICFYFRVSDPQERLHALHRVCQDLPPENFVNLRYLIKFLDKLVSHSDVNKMSSQNIAMAITPSLMWTPGVAGEDATAMHMTATNLHSVIVYNLISHAQFFFPDGKTLSTLLIFSFV